MSINAQEFTYSFLGVIGCLTFAGLYIRLIKNKTNSLIKLLPNIAVSIGILGTFVGIFLGLWGFDVQNINESIPKLLEGLKTAFMTSIAGMVASLILKVAYESKSVIENSKEKIQVDDPLEVLKSIAFGIKNLEKSSKEIESSIVACFRSDEEYSLISQLKLIRQEIIDTRKEVSNSFNEFAEKIAESNTDALVKALEKVIGDFNVLLNELVSESFKELSSAMIKLTEWQENYKDHVDVTQEKINTLIGQMKETVSTLSQASIKISKIDENLVNIDDSISNLTVSAKDISKHIENLKLQNDQLRESISAIKQIGNDAKLVLPSITEHIDNLTKKLESTVLTSTKIFDLTNSKLTDFVETTTENIQKAAESHTTAIRTTIEEIDKGLEEELGKALNSLAGSLASLSGKFVEDYLPLTERLKDVVRMSERIDA